MEEENVPIKKYGFFKKVWYSITKIENFVRVPQYTTLMRLLKPMGYTIKVVPLNKVKK